MPWASTLRVSGPRHIAAPTVASGGTVLLEAIRSFHTFNVRAEGSDFERGIVRQVISTGDVARDGAIIEPGGWELANYRRNPVVLYAHDDSSGGWVGVQAGTRSALPIGRATEVGLDGSSLVATTQFDTDDEFAVRILGKIQRGFINATSVRWMPLVRPERETREFADDDGVTREREVWVFKRNELLEFSYVPIPADPGAVIQRAAGGPIDYSGYGEDPQVEPARSLLVASAPGVLRFLATARLNDAEREVALGIYRALAEALALEDAEREVAPPVVDAPPAGPLGGELFAKLERVVAQATERLVTPLDPTEAVTATLARFTGRTTEDIRRSMNNA